MSLTNEELNQIVNALEIVLPIEGIEEHLHHVYGRYPLDTTQILNDIESGRLTIRPDKICWEILRNENPCAFVYDYVFKLYNQIYYDRVNLDFLVREYQLNEKEIDMQNKERATTQIYMCLMEIAEEAMQEEVYEKTGGDQLYIRHRFKLRCLAASDVDRIINQNISFANEALQRIAFCATVKRYVHQFLSPDENIDA